MSRRSLVTCGSDSFSIIYQETGWLICCPQIRRNISSQSSGMLEAQLHQTQATNILSCISQLNHRPISASSASTELKTNKSSSEQERDHRFLTLPVCQKLISQGFRNQHFKYSCRCVSVYLFMLI